MPPVVYLTACLMCIESLIFHLQTLMRRWMNGIVSQARKGEVPLESCVLPPAQTADVRACFATWSVCICKAHVLLALASILSLQHRTWPDWSTCILLALNVNEHGHQPSNAH